MSALTPTILIVDDHAVFPTSARSLLERGGFRVVGEAATGAEALALAAELGPSVVLLDVQLPDVDGFELAKRLRAMPNPPQIILTSTRDSGDFGSLIAKASARGFVSKAELTSEAIRSLLAV